jgi:hypothetical protein
MPLPPEQVRKQQQADATRDRESVLATLPAIVTPTLPALPAIEGADAYLERNPTMMVGRVIKPNGKTGIIAFTDEETPVPSDWEFIVLIESIWCGWARLEESQPAQYEGGLLFSSKGFRRPGREELGDTDPAQWRLGKFDNEPSDPWKEAVFVPMEERGVGELYTLQIVSKPRSAAIFAVDGLLRHCRALMRRAPDMCPAIKLKMSQYESKRYGMQWKPSFQVVGKAPRTSAAKPDTSISADMDDEIPNFN